MSDDLKAPERLTLKFSRETGQCPIYQTEGGTEYLRADIAAAELRAARERIEELERKNAEWVGLASQIEMRATAAYTRGWNDAIEAAALQAAMFNTHGDWHKAEADTPFKIRKAIAAFRKEQT